MKIAASLLILFMIAPPCLGLEPVQTFQGESAQDQFGISVTGLDMNGDGWTDIVIGANTNDAGASAAGRAYAYLGGGGDSVPDLILAGPVANGHFGWCVRGVGDIDRDGFDDLAVGAHFTSDVSTRSGKVYVFLGSDPLDDTADLIIAEDLYDARMGYALSGGDLNGDGYSDLAAGAPNAYDTGLVRVFLGGDPPDTLCDLTLRGEATYDFFGSALSAGSDLNGDGYDDLVIGAHGWNRGGEFNVGRVYVYLGGEVPDTLVDFVLEGKEQNDYFGYALSTGGDLSLDSIPDLCVGSYGCDIGDSTEVGKCFIFHGGDILGTPADLVVWSGAIDNEGFSSAVALIGSDAAFPPYLLVGAEGSDAGGTDAGRIYTFSGPAPQAGMPDDHAEGNEAGASLGCDVHLLRDFTTSTEGVLALSGAYGEGVSGRARLFGLSTAGLVQRSSRGNPPPLRGNPFRVGQIVQFDQSQGRPDRAVRILDVTGRVIFSAWSNGGAPISWNGSTCSGSHAAPGTYFYVLKPSSRNGKIILLK